MTQLVLLLCHGFLPVFAEFYTRTYKGVRSWVFLGCPRELLEAVLQGSRKSLAERESPWATRIKYECGVLPEA